MNPYREVIKVFQARPTIEGAGVMLKRGFGFSEVPLFDPFLLLDHFGSENPDDYLAGFPWHPHRGIETVTYMLNGEVEHSDSIGNKGVISSGDVQWMTAGCGIVHQEMPRPYEGRMAGFQLWINLPAAGKMIGPRYQEIRKGDIPEVTLDNGVIIKVICGEVNGVRGPVKDIVVVPEYLDIIVPERTEFNYTLKEQNTVLAYVFEGKGTFGQRVVEEEHCVLFNKGPAISVIAEDKLLRFLLISGKPLEEPVAWRGPIVMNTDKELDSAF